MARYRLSPLAEADLAHILAAGRREWRAAGRRRYSAVLAAALRKVAAEPEGPATRDRGELRPGIRGFRLRHARVEDREGRVRRPVHVLYYRAVAPDLTEIVRVLHERMEPSRHLVAALPFC
ncbi:MAG TPA: type II toxin-antitoxin system RelE/ParE family toxin [Stellaceae bacterium]|nr:type II toxin-antitoxin system RelE/ParE family toxin [Stellaceae bacterium]